MTILDTNVVSELMNDPPDSRVIAWLDHEIGSSIWTTSVTILEIESGLQMMPAGKRQTGLSAIFERILDKMEHRITVFDEEAARQSAKLTALRRKKGRVVEMRDTMIAGIVLAHRATLATRNTSHFADLSATVVNPWSA
jgi:predicted nucleic acid-binding protein